MKQHFWENGNYRVDEGWPDAFSVDRIVRLQTDDILEYEVIAGQLRADLNAGLIARTKIVREYEVHSIWIEDESVYVKETRTDYISAPAVRQWMIDNGITPSVHIAAWFDAVIVDNKSTHMPDSATVVDTVNGSINRGSRTWRDVAMPYIKSVYKSGQFATAKEIFKELERKAGPCSPFDLGAGKYKNTLYVREIGQTLELKTLQNAWREIRG